MAVPGSRNFDRIVHIKNRLSLMLFGRKEKVEEDSQNLLLRLMKPVLRLIGIKANRNGLLVVLLEGPGCPSSCSPQPVVCNKLRIQLDANFFVYVMQDFVWFQQRHVHEGLFFIMPLLLRQNRNWNFDRFLGDSCGGQTSFLTLVRKRQKPNSRKVHMKPDMLTSLPR